MLFCCCQMLNLGTLAKESESSPVFTSCTSDDGSGYVSGLSKTVLMTEKIAVFAPIPTAITRMATTVNAGAFISDRTAKRMSRQVDSNDINEEPTATLCPVSGLC